MTAIGATAVGVTAVRNDLKLWTIINIRSTIILWWSLFNHIWSLLMISLKNTVKDCNFFFFIFLKLKIYIFSLYIFFLFFCFAKNYKILSLFWFCHFRRLVFDQSSPVHPVSEARGTWALRTENRGKILLSNIGLP